MQAISQSDFDRLLRRYRDASESEDLAHLDLSGLSFNRTDLSSVTIAMSRFTASRFDQTCDLSGITWIANELRDCSFVDVSLNKAELLDCVLARCLIERAALFRADLTGTQFDRCTLWELDLTQKVCLIRVSFAQCVFRNVKVSDSLTLNGTHDVRFDEQGVLIA